MKRFLACLLCLSMLLFMLTACSKPEDTVDPDAEVEFLIVMITDTYMLGDSGINDSCWAGLQRAASEHPDLRVECVETRSDYSTSIKEAVAMEPDIIICPSEDMASVLATVAPEYEDEIFIIFDAELPDNFNVTTVTFNPEQSAFLAGVVSGKATNRNIVGFMADVTSETNDKYLYGFTAGVVSSNSHCYISTNYIGADSSTRQAKETAVAQYKLGADIIFNVLGSIGSGVMNAADERGFMTVSLTPENAARHPESTMCTISKNGDGICYDIATRLLNGTFDGNTMTYGLKEDAFYVDNDWGRISEETMAEIDEFINQIKNGGYVVPYDNDSYQAFINYDPVAAAAETVTTEEGSGN